MTQNTTPGELHVGSVLRWVLSKGAFYRLCMYVRGHIAAVYVNPLDRAVSIT